MAAFSWSPDPLHIPKPFVTTDAFPSPPPTQATLSVEPPSQAEAQWGARGVSPSTQHPMARRGDPGDNLWGVKGATWLCAFDSKQKAHRATGVLFWVCFFLSRLPWGRARGGGDLFCQAFLVQTSFLKGMLPGAHTPAHSSTLFPRALRRSDKTRA